MVELTKQLWVATSQRDERRMLLILNRILEISIDEGDAVLTRQTVETINLLQTSLFGVLD